MIDNESYLRCLHAQKEVVRVYVTGFASADADAA